MPTGSTGLNPFVGIGQPNAVIDAKYSGATIDAFGRLRTGNVTTLLDVKQTADKQPLLVDEEIIGTATSTHSTDNASTTIATSADLDCVVRQTFQRPPYFNGKGQQFWFTWDNFEPETNITKRVGCFNSNQVTPFNSDLDGIFLESSGGVVSINIYKTGVMIASINQEDWNCNTLDTSSDFEANPSGVVIDWSKPQIMEIKYEWLGVGSVFVSFVNNGVIIQAHQYNHVNSGSSTYMKSPNQPIRYEIRQAGEGSGSFETICSTGGTEGSLNQIGKDFATGTQANEIDANVAGTYYALCGIKLKAAQPNARVEINNVALLADTNDDFYWELRMNPTVAGTFTYADIDNSACQAAIGDTSTNPSPNTVTAGRVVDSGYGKGNDTFNAPINAAVHIGTAIDGTADELVLCVTPFTGSSNLDIGGGMAWREID